MDAILLAGPLVLMLLISAVALRDDGDDSGGSR
jgi:hypothetical protein